MSTLAQTLGEFAHALSYAELPPDVRTHIQQHVLDTIGVALGAAPLETSLMARDLALTWGGHGPSTVLAFGDRLPPAAAGFVNGVLAHSLDFDDTHLPSVLHPSASLVPALVAIAEANRNSTLELITALAIGYEVCNRLGMAAYDRRLGNSVFFEKGWHATSICGTIGVAAAGAKLYGLNTDGIANAIGIAVSLGSGTIEANRTGGSVKRLHCGWAAHAGITAAQCAHAGFTGPATSLEGRFGFFHAFCDGKFDAAEITANLGERWTIFEVFFKPYPANHFTHAIVDAALKLRQRVPAQDVGRVEIGVASPTLRTIAEPRDAKLHPQSGYHAQFSGPFVFAAAFLGGGGLGVWMDDFSDAKVADPKYLALAAMVECHADAECDRIFPSQFPARVRLHTHSGEVLEEMVRVNRGGPGNPLREDELSRKFSLNARRSIDADRATLLASELGRLASADLGVIMALGCSDRVREAQSAEARR